MADAMKLVLDLAKAGAGKAGCDGWRAQQKCRQIVELLERASPPAREEAPAEGAGWRKSAADILARHDAAMENQRDNGPDAKLIVLANYGDLAIQALRSALRNRTSEPEAGAVAWRWRPSKFHPLFKDFPALDWRAGNDRPKLDEPGLQDEWFDVEPLYTHPAPATADKLREAAGLLNDCIWLDTDTGDYRVEHDGSVEKARAILAALNEQPQ